MGSEPRNAADSGVDVEDRLQGKALENVHTSVVKPSTATPGQKEWLELSKLDLLFVPFYTPILCTFTLAGPHKFGSVDRLVQHLKDSFADTLVLFYPLAGRLVFGDGPAPRIHCNDAGAVFTEASVDVEMVELRWDDFQPQMLLSGMSAAGLGGYPALPQMEDGLPALIIQVTRFKCGGITLAATWAHATADVQSGFHFMKSWSELARGLQVSLPPDHRRTELVRPRKVPGSNNPFKASVVSAGAQIIASPKTKEERDDKQTKEVCTITTKVIGFMKEDIAKLKKEAYSDHHDPNVQLSRADCLSTHLWRTAARARNLCWSSPTRLIYLVEGRKQLSLPPGYFGNAIGFKTIITTVDEFVNGPFGSTASLVRSAISTITAERFQDLVDFMQRGAQDGFGEDEIAPPNNLGISYLTRFPFYELDFGFGVPAHALRNTMATRDGLIFVVPSSHGPDHMLAMANFNAQIMPIFVSMAHDTPE